MNGDQHRQATEVRKTWIALGRLTFIQFLVCTFADAATSRWPNLADIAIVLSALFFLSAIVLGAFSLAEKRLTILQRICGIALATVLMVWFLFVHFGSSTRVIFRETGAVAGEGE